MPPSQKDSDLKGLIAATEKQTRVLAWTERARRFEWIGEVSDDHVRGANAALWKLYGQRKKVPENEIVQVIMTQRTYEYLLFCFEQEQLLEGSGLGIDYAEWVRTMIVDSEDLVQVHLMSGIAYPRFAHWFNRVVFRQGVELRARTDAASKRLGKKLVESARQQARQIFSRGYVRGELEKRAQSALHKVLKKCSAIDEAENILKDHDELVDQLFQHESVSTTRW